MRDFAEKKSRQMNGVKSSFNLRMYIVHDFTDFTKKQCGNVIELTIADRNWQRYLKRY